MGRGIAGPIKCAVLPRAGPTRKTTHSAVPGPKARHEARTDTAHETRRPVSVRALQSRCRAGPGRAGPLAIYSPRSSRGGLAAAVPEPWLRELLPYCCCARAVAELFPSSCFLPASLLLMCTTSNKYIIQTPIRAGIRGPVPTSSVFATVRSRQSVHPY